MSTTRYMVSDRLTLDDHVACIVMTFPTRLSPEELQDVQDWFALRVRQWERSLIVPTVADETPGAAACLTPR